MRANISTVPVPDRRYSADTCSVISKSDTIMILFGQQKVTTADLRNLLVVKMSPESAAQMVLMADEISSPSLKEVAKSQGIDCEQSLAPVEEPANTVCLNASLALLAIHKRESCVDFMQISPFAMHASRTSQQLAIDAVVRVDIRSSLMLGLIESLRNSTKDICVDSDLVKESGNE